MEKLSTKLRLVRSQSMGVGMGGVGSSNSSDKVSRRGHASGLGHLEGSGRSASIVLLDERRLEMLVQPRLYAGELLDLVASHCQLKEKEYFGLAVVDDNGHYTWLQLDRKVLDHDLPRKPLTLTVQFLVKFFIESICHLAENKTVELFYLQARSLIFRGTLEVESEIVFQLAALSLQASHGDHVDEGTTRNLVKKSPVLPAAVLKEHASLTFCEDQVIEHYKKTRGQTRGQALVNYMTIVESMPTYGVHYFEVLDKRQTPWWLGLSCKGIAQYDHSDRKVPVRVFPWKQLENLYFRDKKFSIEVHDAKRVVQTLSSFNLYEDALKLDNSGSSQPAVKDELVDAIADSTTQVSVSRRSYTPGNIHVYVWFGKTQTLTKCIWQSAISQHQFYLDRKQAKMRHVPQRTLKEIARDLTRSSASLSSASSISNLSRSGSTHSLAISGSLSMAADGDAELQSEETRRLRMEMLSALKARKEALESKMKEKNKLLKELCIKEGELTGELPPEIPLEPGELPPAIRRRVGTEFALSEDLLKKDSKSPEEDMRASLELEYEIQNKITAAALKIATDSRAPKSVRKQRKVSYQQSLRRLRELEAKLNNLKHVQHQQMLQKQRRKQPRPDDNKPRRGMSVPDLDSSIMREETESPISEDGVEVDTTGDQVGGTLSPRSCPASPRKYTGPTASVHADSISLQASPQRLLRGSSSTSSTSGYIPSSVYLRSSYRSKQFPTLSTAGGSTAGIDASVGLPLSPTSTTDRSATLPSPYRNKYEMPNLQLDSPVGLYNCPQQRTSQAFSSMDDLDALTAPTTHHQKPVLPRPQQQQHQQYHKPHAQYPPKSTQSSSPYVPYAQQQKTLNHRYVLGHAREAMAKAEAATASAITLNNRYPSLERSISSAAASAARKKYSVPVAQRELPALPVSKVESSRSMEDLDSLEASGIHGRSKMHYREVAAAGNKDDNSISSSSSNTNSHNLPNTEEYPPHTSSTTSRTSSVSYQGGLRAGIAIGDEGGPYPLPPSHRSSTLLPGQTYPEHSPVKPLAPAAIKSLQDVFYHREMRMAAAAVSALSSSTSNQQPKKEVQPREDESPPPPPLYPKQYHAVVEQRRRSGLDRPTAVAVPAVPADVPLESPAVNRKIKPASVSAADTSGSSMAESNTSFETVIQQQNNDSSKTSTLKYVPFVETSKPFEMSDFYKYSTKYRKASASSLTKSESSGGDSDSSRHSTASSRSAVSNGSSVPPELPAKPAANASPIKSGPPAPPPPPPPPAKYGQMRRSLVNNNNNSNNGGEATVDSSLADSFSSEMLAWYNTQKQKSSNPPTTASKNKNNNNNNSSSSSSSSSNSNSTGSTKPATLV